MRLLISVSFLLLTYCALAQNSTETYLKVSKGRYSLGYPKSWTADTVKRTAADLFLKSPKTDSTDDFIENINVIVQGLEGQKYDLPAMGKEGEEGVKQRMEGVEILESKVEVRASPQYYSLKYNMQQGGNTYIITQRFYLKDGIAYVVTASTKAGAKKDYTAEFARIMNSFQLR